MSASGSTERNGRWRSWTEVDVGKRWHFLELPTDQHPSIVRSHLWVLHRGKLAVLGSECVCQLRAPISPPRAQTLKCCRRRKRGARTELNEESQRANVMIYYLSQKFERLGALYTLTGRAGHQSPGRANESGPSGFPPEWPSRREIS